MTVDEHDDVGILWDLPAKTMFRGYLYGYVGIKY